MPAATTNDVFSIELAPPREPLPPSVWEANKATILGGLGLSILFVLVLAWWLSRRRTSSRPAPVPGPRRELEALRGRARDAALATDIALIVRGVLRARLGINDEATTPDLNAALRGRADIPLANSELAIRVLQRCDAFRFSPSPTLPPPLSEGSETDLIAEAIAVVERFEVRPPSPDAADSVKS